MPTLSTLADVVSSLATPGTVALERRGSGTTNAAGEAVEPTPTTTQVLPSVIHPVTGRDRQALPEGVRGSEVIAVFTIERLRTVLEDGHMADVIIHTPFGGVSTRYVVQTAENWGHASGHWRNFCTREENN